MQPGIDLKIQAQVRILLARKWVDLRSVTVGTTNGVVYLGGDLGNVPGTFAGAAGPPEDRKTAWLRRLHQEISQIPEVRDVIFQWDEPTDVEGAWRRESA